jgi:hypothetical protein
MIGAVALPGLSEDDTQRGRSFLRTAEVQPERWSEVRTNDRVLDAGNAAATALRVCSTGERGKNQGCEC